MESDKCILNVVREKIIKIEKKQEKMRTSGQQPRAKCDVVH